MFTFVILHYKNIKDTLECIHSIKKISEKNKKIIIVDNHTLDKSEEKILENKVDDLIIMSDNVGFAKANNKGCQVAIEKYSPLYLIVINNDTVIEQENFCQIIEESDKKYKFDILGPKINCPLGSGSVNPYSPLKTLNEVEDEIKYQKKLAIFYKSSVLFFGLQWYLKIKKLIKYPRILENGKILQDNVCLHGCALVFSKQYYKKFSTIFYNETFLYHEEDFLYVRIKSKNLISIYNPKLEINHKEGASLNTKFSGNTRLKLLFRTEEIIKSLELLKIEMKKSEGEQK